MKSRELSRIDVEREKLAQLVEKKLEFQKVEEIGLATSSLGLEIRKQDLNLLEGIEKVTPKIGEATKKLNKEKEESIQKDLRAAAISGQSAKDAMKSVVRAESMEAVAGLISSIFKTVPYPLNLVLAAGAGATASTLIDKGLAKFADGGIVQGDPSKGDSVPAMLTAGELILNQSQQDNLVGQMGGITLNISAPLVDETVVDSIIPAIEKAQRMNTA